MKLGRLILCIAATIGALAFAAQAHAADYPNRPIKWVVGYPPGGASDYLVRAIASEMEKDLHGTIVIENKPGATGIVAASSVHQSPADGYTLLLESDGYFNNVALGEKFNFDPLDFDYLTRLAVIPNIVVVPATSPFKTIQDLIDAAKKNPDKLQFASGGIGTGTHIATELFMKQTGIKMVHIPYKGTQAPLIDLVAGRIDVMFAGAAPAMPLIKSGQLRPIAVTSAEPIAALPGVPPVANTVPHYDQQTWYVAMAPKGLSAPVKDSLVHALHQALDTDSVKTAIAKFGFVASPTTPEQFAGFLKTTIESTKEIGKEANINLRGN
ncbi:MAG TPA: tripartite tricarboxylate transporter substrate binding protein [Xanthobacteraceae bacterium]|jgi:tripartite-type tricarboxylate transporter receptor subunit TctC|nr:tripartite tricarboxylate transporter substrate binding protein [Xanthobacteraceae bacterium]